MAKRPPDHIEEQPIDASRARPLRRAFRIAVPLAILAASVVAST